MCCNFSRQSLYCPEALHHTACHSLQNMSISAPQGPAMVCQVEFTLCQLDCHASWECPVQGHSGAIIALAHILVGDMLLLFSSAEDTQVLVWEGSLASHQGTDSPYSQWTLRQKLDGGNGLQHCLAVAEVPRQHGWLVTACPHSSSMPQPVVFTGAETCCCLKCHILYDKM